MNYSDLDKIVEHLDNLYKGYDQINGTLNDDLLVTNSSGLESLKTKIRSSLTEIEVAKSKVSNLKTELNQIETKVKNGG